VGDAESLWLEREPTVEEVKFAFDQRKDLHEVNEVVFCGYGEPMVRADDVIEIAEYIKRKTSLKVRINTNGLVKLLVPDFEMNKLAAVDNISVSLNADDAEEYMRIVNPQFGIESFDAMIDFAKEAKVYIDVALTVMDILNAERIENCKRIAGELDVPLRVRRY